MASGKRGWAIAAGGVAILLLAVLVGPELLRGRLEESPALRASLAQAVRSSLGAELEVEEIEPLFETLHRAIQELVED